MPSLLRVKHQTTNLVQYSVRGVNAHANIVCTETSVDDAERWQQYAAEIVEVLFVEDVTLYVNDLAKKHPGCEIEVYNLERISQCPVGEVVTKQISKNGVLPL